MAQRSTGPRSWRLPCITIVAAILRFYLLGKIPRIINGDEGAMGLIAQTTDIR